MKNALLSLYVKLECLASGEEAQDLVEYGLLVTLIALVCILSISNMAVGVSTAFSNIGSSMV